MLIDGEKWACDACVRGHRVSNCQHSDRRLQHINKKGRPVSQCQHCRGLRKSRSAHVKCDCGENGHAPGHCGHSDKENKTDPCCCSHGGKCSCASKKEMHLDPVPELGPATGLVRSEMDFPRPRLVTTQSESALAVFSNGHHKPSHKHNHMSQKRGVPYKIPRPHSVHGSSELARRSVDSLPMASTLESTLAAADPIKDSILSAQQEVRRVKSEHGSPHPTAAATLDDLNGSLPPLDLSFTDYVPSGTRSAVEVQSVTSAPFETYFCGTPDTDQGIFSAGLDAPSVDWSHFDLPLNPAAFSSPYNQPPSYASFDYRNLGQQAISNASTGEPSDIGDFAPFGNPSPLRPPSLIYNRFPSDSSEMCESDTYRLSGTSSFHNLPQVAMLASNDLENLDIDDFINRAATNTAGHSSTGESLNDSSPSSYSSETFSSPITKGPTSVPSDEPYTLNSLPLDAPLKLETGAVTREDISFSLPASADGLDSPWIARLDSVPGVLDSEAEVMWGS